MMEKKVYELIDSYRDDFTKMLQRWVRIPSVKSEAEDGAPFGRKIRNMLDTAMEDARKLDLRYGTLTAMPAISRWAKRKKKSRCWVTWTWYPWETDGQSRLSRR